MKKSAKEIPSLDQLQTELARVRYRSRYRSALRSTICTLIVAAAVAVLVATIWMPGLQIYGSSMTPTLREGDIVVSIRDRILPRATSSLFTSETKSSSSAASRCPGIGWTWMKTAASMWTAGGWRKMI